MRIHPFFIRVFREFRGLSFREFRGLRYDVPL